MELLASILHDESTGSQHSSVEPIAAPIGTVVFRMTFAEGHSHVHRGELESPMFESAVAYLDQPNPFLVLARTYDRPEGYGDYELDPSELEEEPAGDAFPLNLPESLD